MSAPVQLTSVQLLYFPICGRGEPIRYILEDAGVAYEESNDGELFGRGKMDCDEFAFGQLPRVTVRLVLPPDNTSDGPRFGARKSWCVLGMKDDELNLHVRAQVNGRHLFQQDAILRFFAKTCGASASQRFSAVVPSPSWPKAEYTFEVECTGYHYSGDVWKEALVDQLQDACEVSVASFRSACRVLDVPTSLMLENSYARRT